MHEVICGDSVVEMSAFPGSYFDSLVCDPPCGIDLDGMGWDSSYGGRDGWIEVHRRIFAEAFRVLRPGAYGLAWSIPRTSHWTALALEYAGFEIRDVVTHLYASGMPKGQAVDKLIDRALGTFDQRPVVGHKEVPDFSKGGLPAVGGRRGPRPKKVVDITRPAHPTAQRYEGWQTSLKPSGEPWWLVRKPVVEETVTKNVIQHGTGALNIPGCRVGGPDGKWPPNVVVSHDPDCSDEECAPGCAVRELGEKAKHFPTFRFVPKPTKKERELAGKNNHPTLKPVDLMRWMVRLVTPPGGRVLDIFGGSGTTGVGAVMEGFPTTVIEREPAFAEICRRRLSHAEGMTFEDLM